MTPRVVCIWQNVWFEVVLAPLSIDAHLLIIENSIYLNNIKIARVQRGQSLPNQPRTLILIPLIDMTVTVNQRNSVLPHIIVDPATHEVATINQGSSVQVTIHHTGTLHLHIERTFPQ